MSLPAHLDLHFSDLPLAREVWGEITGIFPPGHPENWSGDKLILYQATTRQYWPLTEEVLPPCPAANQMWGILTGNSDFIDTYEIGEQVWLSFWENDHNRPVICGRVHTWDNKYEAVTEDDLPLTRFRRRGMETEIDKNGKMKLTLAPNQPLEIVDANGNLKLEITGAGVIRLHGDVELGGDSGLRALMTDAMIAAFNGHKHTGVTTGLDTSGVPDTLLSTGSHTTSVTKAK